MTMLPFQKQGRFVDAADFIRNHSNQGDVVSLPNVRDAWALNWYLFGPGWDQDLTISSELLWRPLLWPKLLDEIRSYDRRPRHGNVDVVSTSRSSTNSYPGQIWLIARNEDQLNTISKNFKNGRNQIVYRAPGLIISGDLSDK
jgi:hypothetical protein